MLLPNSSPIDLARCQRILDLASESEIVGLSEFDLMDLYWNSCEFSGVLDKIARKEIIASGLWFVAYGHELRLQKNLQPGQYRTGMYVDGKLKWNEEIYDINSIS